jgi:hypothetical protein
MKRVDTGAVNFTAISWGEDVLDTVGYEPVVYFSDVIGEAEQGGLNISPSQTVSLENQGQLSGEGKLRIGTSKGVTVSKVNQTIVIEIEKSVGLQRGAYPGRISNAYRVTAGPNREQTTIRVPPSRLTPRRR